MKASSNLKKIGLIGLLVSILVGTVLVFPINSVKAAVDPQAGTPPAQPSNPAGGQAQQVTRVENIYQRELRTLQAQGNRLNRVSTLTQKAEDLLAKLQAKGIDVSALQAALDDFKATIPSAQAAHDSAKAILAVHAGFDDNGKVTDIKVARETVRTAGQDLKEAHQIIQNAFQDLIREIRQFRQAHKGALRPNATPTPE